MKQPSRILILLLFALSFSRLVFCEPVPTSLTILTEDDFIGRPYFSVADALRSVPSLNIERVGSQGTRAVAKIRGVSSEKNVDVLIDGESLSHSFDGRVDLSQIPINIVQRIEISRGGGPVSFGSNAAAGTINIVTLRPDKNGITTRLGTGVGRDGVKHSHGQVRGRSYWGDFTYLGSIEESNGFVTNEDSKANNHFVNVSRSFNGKGFWSAEYFYQDSRVGLGQGTPVAFDQWNRDLEQESSEPFRLKKETDQHAKVSLVSPRLKEGILELTLTYRLRESDILLRDSGPSTQDKGNRSLEGRLKWQRSSYEVGLRREQLKQSLFGRPDSRAFEQAMYAVNKFVWGRWTVVPGINAVHHSELGPAVDPRAAVIFDPKEYLSFSATAQTSHRAPNFDELFFSTGVTANPNLRFEKSHSSDLGATWTPHKNISLSLTGFQIRIYDAIAADANNRWRNTGKEKTTGVEAHVRVELGEGRNFRHIAVAAEGTAHRSRRDGAKSPMTPGKMGAIAFTQYLPRSLTLTNTLRYQGQQWELAGEQGLKVPSYMVWDLRLGCKILSADLYFEAQNLAARRYADTYETFAPSTGGTQSRLAPQPERTFWAGLSIRFEN